jgi:hypothetical protein
MACLFAPSQPPSLAAQVHGRTISPADTVQKGPGRIKVALRWVRIAEKLT